MVDISPTVEDENGNGISVDNQLAFSILGKFLAEDDPSFEQHLKEIIDRGFSSGISGNTWSVVGASLLDYVGPNAAELIARFLADDDLEAVLRSEIVGMRLTWYLEMAGILCVGSCAVRNYWWHTRKQGSRTSLTAPGG